jgi:hypothetical protein
VISLNKLRRLGFLNYLRETRAPTTTAGFFDEIFGRSV